MVIIRHLAPCPVMACTLKGNSQERTALPHLTGLHRQHPGVAARPQILQSTRVLQRVHPQRLSSLEWHRQALLRGRSSPT